MLVESEFHTLLELSKLRQKQKGQERMPSPAESNLQDYVYNKQQAVGKGKYLI